MSSIAKASIALLTLLSLGCTSAAPLPAEDALGIGLSIRYADSGDSTRQPILRVEFINSSDSPVAFSKTFGYGAFHWIGVQIRDAEGHLVPYPVDADLFHHPPLSCNVVDFTWDDAGRLAASDRSTDTAAFLYDGRSFLRQGGDAAGPGLVLPTYDSSGLLHCLQRQLPTGTTDYYVFYLAGRPVGQVALENGQPERWWYFTTDHLGTPVVATDSNQDELWVNRFDPFGEDPMAGTQNGASEQVVFLRFPGQWDDPVWRDAMMGAKGYQNVWRWYAPATGRYTRTDPLGLDRSQAIEPNPYIYAGASPLRMTDPLGMYQVVGGGEKFKKEVEEGMKRIQDGLSRKGDECCAEYFASRNQDLAEWLSPGGPPYITQARGAMAKGMQSVSACGQSQKSNPFTYIFLNPGCFRKPDPCKLASIIMHEMGHLARRDTTDYEPEDFFRTCSAACVKPGRFR